MVRWSTMKRRISPIRFAAVASSVVLLGGYVWYRAGAAPAGGASPMVDPLAAEKDVILPGSKSAEIFPAVVDPAEAPKQRSRDRAVMGGSKSARVVDPKDVPDGAPKQFPLGEPDTWQPPETPPLLTPPANPPASPPAIPK